jgi:hypothetical protein
MEFKQKPICEMCRKQAATRLVMYPNYDWAFVCEDCEYTHPLLQSVDIEYSFRSPEHVVDLLVSLDKEPDYPADWEQFMKMMFRFREATDSFDPSRCYCLEYPDPTPNHCDPTTCPSKHRFGRFADGW